MARLEDAIVALCRASRATVRPDASAIKEVVHELADALREEIRQELQAPTEPEVRTLCKGVVAIPPRLCGYGLTPEHLSLKDLWVTKVREVDGRFYRDTEGQWHVRGFVRCDGNNCLILGIER